MDARADFVDEQAKLPEGWIVDLDHETKKRFYRNKNTQEGQWVRPTEPAPLVRANDDIAIGDEDSGPSSVNPWIAPVQLHVTDSSDREPAASAAMITPTAAAGAATTAAATGGGGPVTGADASADSDTVASATAGEVGAGVAPSAGGVAAGGSGGSALAAEQLRQALASSTQALHKVKQDGAQALARCREQLKQQAWALQEAEAEAKAAVVKAQSSASSEEIDKVQVQAADARADALHERQRADSAAAALKTLRERVATLEAGARRAPTELQDALAASRASEQARAERDAAALAAAEARARRAEAAASARASASAADAAEAEVESEMARQELVGARAEAAHAKREVEMLRERLAKADAAAACGIDGGGVPSGGLALEESAPTVSEGQGTATAATEHLRMGAELAEAKAGEGHASARAAAAEQALVKAEMQWSAQLAEARAAVEVQSNARRRAEAAAEVAVNTAAVGRGAGARDDVAAEAGRSDGSLRRLLLLLLGAESPRGALLPAQERAGLLEAIGARVGFTAAEVGAPLPDCPVAASAQHLRTAPDPPLSLIPSLPPSGILGTTERRRALRTVPRIFGQRGGCAACRSRASRDAPPPFGPVVICGAGLFRAFGGNERRRSSRWWWLAVLGIVGPVWEWQQCNRGCSHRGRRRRHTVHRVLMHAHPPGLLFKTV